MDTKVKPKIFDQIRDSLMETRDTLTEWAQTTPELKKEEA